MRARWLLIGALAVAYWGGLATILLAYRQPDPGLRATLLRGPGPVPPARPAPRPGVHGYWQPLGPSWAPHERPRVLGLATGPSPAMLVR